MTLSRYIFLYRVRDFEAWDEGIYQRFAKKRLRRGLAEFDYRYINRNRLGFDAVIHRITASASTASARTIGSPNTVIAPAKQLGLLADASL